jgi:exonuclease SbcC
MEVNAAVFATHGRELSALREAQNQTGAALAKANAGRADAERERSACAERVAAARVALEASQTRAQSVKEGMARIQQAQQLAVENWNRLGFSGPPSEQAAENLRLASETGRALCRRLAERREAAVRGLGQWRSHQALRREENAILTELAGRPTDEHTAELQAAEYRVVANLACVNGAAKLEAELSSKLRDRQKQFTEAVLSPFEERVTAFERLISPFQHTIRFRSRPHRNRTAFTVHVANPRPITGDQPDEHPISAFSSEGQISATGVSITLAASTAYAWSRWPALLLDDPLQHTDLIHASAFVDVLRTLILERKYQVILSSHDPDEANFIARKCRHFSIAVQQCMLIGTGERGVRWRVANDF